MVRRILARQDRWRHALPAALLAVVVAGLAACSSIETAQHGAASPPPPVHDTATRQNVLMDALGQIGRPYVYGGADASGFDCSGLVHTVYARAGVKLPRTAAEQFKAGRRISLKHAAPGDLVFYRIGGGMHVTIYVGHDEVVQAPSSGKTVSITHIDRPWWRHRYAGTVRVLN